MGTLSAERLGNAIEHHQAGRFGEARALYDAFLRDDPGNIDARHLLGVLLTQTGQPDEAVDLISTAIEMLPGGDHHPGAAMILCNLGNAQRAAGQLDAAVVSFRRAIAIRADLAEAHNNLGNVLGSIGQAEESLACFRAALALRPDDVATLGNYALTLSRNGRHEAAIPVLRDIIDRVPNPLAFELALARSLRASGEIEEALMYLRLLAEHTENEAVYAQYGLTLQAAGQLREGLAWCVRSALAAPNSADAMLTLGRALAACGNAIDAAAAFADATTLDPTHSEAWFERGRTAQTRGLPIEASEHYGRVTTLAPRLVEGWFNLGNALHRAKRPSEAAAAYGRILELDPNHAEALAGLATALHETDDSDRAISLFQRAIALRPNFAEALFNLANTLQDVGQLDQAIEFFERALSVQPDNIEMHWNHGLALLTKGEFEAGWRKFEYRWHRPASTLVTRRFTVPQWLGDAPLDGQTILLHAEQGLGDTLQFCRYLPLVRARGAARIILEVQPPLLTLMRDSFGAADVTVVPLSSTYPAGDDLPAFETHCPLMSLPLALGTTLDTVPATMPYLTVDPARVARWSDRLGQRDGRTRIGLVWAGECRREIPEAVETDRRRSIALAEFRPLLDVSGVHLISLQKGAPADQIKAPPFHETILDVMPEITDFADTAALSSLLDLVISVDTSVAHLTGALGVPTWVLARRNGCWRWLYNRVNSPWYPGMRLYHQALTYVWDPVIARIVHDLGAVLGSKSIS